MGQLLLWLRVYYPLASRLHPRQESDGEVVKSGHDRAEVEMRVLHGVSMKYEAVLLYGKLLTYLIVVLTMIVWIIEDFFFP